MYNKNGIGYQDNGSSKAAADFNTEGKLTLRQKVADLFDKGRSTVTEHIQNILTDGELDENSVCRNFRRTAKDGRLTAEQVANLLNKAEISVKPRISELKKEGYIKNSGDKVIGKWGTSISVWEKV